ncbi:hypothetical protein BDW59DRAFT_177444 [Aspergillus cavernicola]|uniref:NmrA-like domain-containing protein n=1 Tax=Aspergillus cavernicola TaxID=176166 RepID=A0ABR4HL65_9EURO
MVNVAVAGGTGGVGRTIIEVLDSSHHQGFTFSRKPAENQEQTPNQSFITADYTNIPNLVTTLETLEIHTVISTFAVKGDSLATSQANLIEAVKISKYTKRFIPSGFAISSLQTLPQPKDYFSALSTLQASNLEYAVFTNGIFLDYFAPPGCSILESYLKPNVFVIDIANRVAAIPGDGDVPVWPQQGEEGFRVVGHEISWNRFVRMGEDVLGSKFEVHYDSIEELKRFEIKELPGHQTLYAHFPKKAFQWFMSIFELFTADGNSCIKREGTLNELFPEIEPLTVRGMLEYWRDQ